MSFVKFNKNTYLDLRKICSIYTTMGFDNKHILNIRFIGEYNASFVYKTEEKALKKMEEVVNMINKTDMESEYFDVFHF